MSKKVKNLFIDDQVEDFSRADGRAIRDPKIIDPERDYTSVKSYDEAISYMNTNGCPNFISFDHDLGVDEKGNLSKTGYDVAKWMVERDLDEDGWILSDFAFQVHSANSIGKRNIEMLFMNYFKSRPRGKITKEERYY